MSEPQQAEIDQALSQELASIHSIREAFEAGWRARRSWEAWADAGGPTVLDRIASPSKVREGDQALPLPADGPSMQDLVLADIEARKAIGLQRYGQLLKADDGRDNLRDLYEELLDAAIYARKELYRRDGK